jgi:hypothetical protein
MKAEPLIAAPFRSYSICLQELIVSGAVCLVLLLQVEAQIEEVSASVEAATKSLPQLTKEQQAAQVSRL